MGKLGHAGFQLVQKLTSDLGHSDDIFEPYYIKLVFTEMEPKDSV